MLGLQGGLPKNRPGLILMPGKHRLKPERLKSESKSFP